MQLKSNNRFLGLFLAFVLLVSMFSVNVLAAGETAVNDNVTYGTKTDTGYGSYTYVNVKGLTPYVYTPTGAGSGTSGDFTNVTGMMNAYGKQNGIVVAINAGIFYNAGTKTQYCYNYKEADGVVIANGVVLKSTESIDHTGCDILVIDENGSVGWTDYYANADDLAAGRGYYYDLHGNKVEGKKIVSAVTGFVPILVDGKTKYDPADTRLSGFDNFVGHYAQKANRQIFGVKADGTYGILTNTTTWTLADAAEAAKAEGFVFAYNLDGGGSAETVVASGTGDSYTVKTIVSQSKGYRSLPTYIVFTGDNKAPWSATPQTISATISKDSFDSGVKLNDLIPYLTVTETFGNANKNTSTRTLYSQQGLDMNTKLTQTLVGGATTLAGCTDKKTAVAPNGTLYYTKTEQDAATSLMLNSNTRQDGKYYDYSTGYILSTDDSLTTAGEKTVRVTYIPGSGQPALSCKVNITIAGDVASSATADMTKHTVALSNQAVKVNGDVKAFEVYNIDGSNYFRLRDIAYVLNGTGSQFSVSYDEIRKLVACETGKPYSAQGGELAIGADKSGTAVPSTQGLAINGKNASLTAFNIGGSNFLKLRDMSSALNFTVDYDEAGKTVLIKSAA